MAENEKSDIREKLGIESGMTVVILHEPNWFHYNLGDLPQGVTIHRDADEQPADLFLIFAASPDEAQRGLERALTVLPPHGAIWVAWERHPPDDPGKLDEDVIRDLFEDTGMVDDRSSVINDTWQGLRFVVAEENRDRWEEMRAVRE